jgi:hypothetical protein
LPNNIGYNYFYYLFFNSIFYRHDANPLPSSIPPPLNPHNRRVDDCVAGEEEVLIEGVEVEVEAEEVVEEVGVGQKHYEEPGPRGSAADFLLGEEMEGDPSGREEVEAAAIKPASHSPQHH